MSSLSITDPDGVCDDPLAEFWSLYQEILLEETINGTDNVSVIEENPINHEATKIDSVDFTHVEQHHLASREAGIMENYNNGLKLMKDSTGNSKRRKRNLINLGISGQNIEGPSSVTKKQDHNAKERIRRMKVNASLLALRELLPDHPRKSKKRLKAPAIVDRALKFIPELENEIEELISKKENVKSQVQNNKININGNSQHQSCTVSMNEINEREAIFQICIGRENNDQQEQGSAFTNLLQRVENEGVYIKSASTVYVCDTRTCYNLHIQMNRISYGAAAGLQEKLLSWLK